MLTVDYSLKSPGARRGSGFNEAGKISNYLQRRLQRRGQLQTIKNLKLK
jgi:hypothetical protein